MNGGYAEDVRTAIGDEPREAGHGASGVVLGRYGSGGRYFVAYNQFGRVRYLDSQAGTELHAKDWRPYNGFIFLRTH